MNFHTDRWIIVWQIRKCEWQSRYWNRSNFTEIPNTIYYIFLFFLQLIRLHIDTPVLYEQFVNGEIGDDYLGICIFATAHPNVLSLPKLFANHTYIFIRFEDEHQNVISTRAQQSHIQAVFMKGDNMIQHLPDNYSKVDLFITKKAALSSHDYDYLFQMKQLTNLLIKDRSNIAIDLSQRVSELGSLTNLAYMDLSVQPHSYKELKVGPFLLALPLIRIFNFEIGDLTRNQAIEFVENQEIPDHFTMNFVYGARTVQFLNTNPPTA